MLFQLFACTFDAGVSVVIQASLWVAYRALRAFFETLNVASTANVLREATGHIHQPQKSIEFFLSLPHLGSVPVTRLQGPLTALFSKEIFERLLKTLATWNDGVDFQEK